MTATKLKQGGTILTNNGGGVYLLNIEDKNIFSIQIGDYHKSATLSDEEYKTLSEIFSRLE